MIDDSDIVPVKVKIGQLDVISSGSIISSANNEIKINIGYSSPISIILAFDDSEEGGDFKKSHFEGKALGPASIKITLYNFTNPLGIYPISPIKIGNFQQRELYFDFIVHHHSGEVFKTKAPATPRKVVHYTILVGNSDSGVWHK